MIFAIAVTLAMDALAVAISNGVSMPKMRKAQALIIGIYFGGFQFLMPLAGYFAGQLIDDFLEKYGPWITFGVLVIIGGKMVIEALKHKEEIHEKEAVFSHPKLIVQAIATSIDAFAVGVTLAFSADGIVQVLWACGVIGVVALVFSTAGALFGKKIGGFFQKRAELAGGIVLIVLGILSLF